jgi:superfamily I DNA/RNA helicase
MVRGRKSLEKMLKILAGLDWVRGTVSLDGYTHLLTDIQREEWEIGRYCSLLGDSEEIVWGVVRDHGGYRVACRCYRTECRNFPVCRPDYVPEKTILAQAPDEIQFEKKDFEPEPPLETCRLELRLPDLDQESITDEGQIVEVTLQDEPLIPGLEQLIYEGKDEVQDAIITAEASEMMLVLAGPGTGKTHSLLRRLEYMVDEKRMVEASSVLLLCFTRAAVREIRDRFLAGVRSGRYSDDLSRMDIRTFDSFATRVLVERDVDFNGCDYDTRIQMVIDEINSDPDILQEMKHFMVDEIQDLVGVRARLVQTILKNRPPGCGFTLLGDPHQAIYDYNVKDKHGEMNSRGFLKWLQEEYGDRLKIVRLTTNRRQSGKLVVFTARARSVLETEEPGKVPEFLESIKEFPAEHDCINIVSSGTSTGKVAVLCRNNGEVLKISGYLWQQQIAHTIRRQHSKWLLPIWIADLLGGERRKLTRNDVADLEMPEWGITGNPDSLFGLLQELAGTDGRTVDTEKVRRALTVDTRLPDELYEGPPFPITVSTIHQAKGREYDRVYLLEPEGIERIEDMLEEARVYYVAVTRARSDFRRLERARTFTWLRCCENGRWIELGKKQDGNTRLVGMEIGLEQDIDEESFVDSRLPGLDPHERQRYIRNNVSAGDPLVITLFNDDTGCYGIYHRGQLIGLMSRVFTFGVKEVMNYVYIRSQYLPRSFSEVYVERVYSVVKKPETVTRNVAEPYMSTGVWYGVSLAGMGKVRFN